MQSHQPAPHHRRRKILSRPVLAAGGVMLMAAAGVAWACADVSCQPGWSLAAPGYDCAGRAAISPGNDTRINLLLLMRSLQRAGAKVSALSSATISAPASATADERQLGQTFMSWQGMRAAFWPTPAAQDAGAAIAAPACNPPTDLHEELASERSLPPADRAALATLRARVGCGAVNWDAPVTSATGREYLAYLKAADAFYAGNWVAARQGFASLAHAHSAWVAETSAYMPIRIGLRAAVAAATDKYGDFDAAKLDAAAVAEARASIAAYLKAWPKGRYAASAQGLMRRVLWLEGNRPELARTYEHLLTTISGDDEAAADLSEEIDLRVLGSDTSASAQDVETLARLGNTPLLLAVADLKRMRQEQPDEKGKSAPFPLSAADLAGQAGQFRNYAELSTFLTATRDWYAGEPPKAILAIIPDDSHHASYTPLAFSSQMLRGMALARAHDPNAAGFWRDLLGGANAQYQRPLVELGLAVRWQHDGRLDQIFAPSSPITDATTREILLRSVAPPAILRDEARNATRPAHERDIALFTLLYKDLRRGAYADFNRDVALVSPAANLDAGLYSLAEQEGVPVGLFARGKWSDDFTCPSVSQTAATLARAPTDAKAQLCLGDFWRLNGFDGFALFISGVQSDALGNGPDTFPGQSLYRDAIYAALIADHKTPPTLRAYALYRAVMCYAPSGYNGCSAPTATAADMAAAEAKVPKSQRKAWFQELKTTYPNSPWAKALNYYW